MKVVLRVRSCYVVALLSVALLAGCETTEQSSTLLVAPTPTLSAGFEPVPTTVLGALHPHLVATALPPSKPTPYIQLVDEIPVYVGTLDTNWTTKSSWGVHYISDDKTYTRDGSGVIAVTPTDHYGALFFAVRPKATTIYTRARVLGVSFWLSGGDQPIPKDALAVTVLGSNQYPYWRKDDTSVKLDGRVTDDSPLFPETRLYYLDIRHTIPPKTWVEVTNWLDKLAYEPSYTYVTGIYIKNDLGFQQTYYIDHVRLLVGQ